jgi:hypothetical protein
MMPYNLQDPVSTAAARFELRDRGGLLVLQVAIDQRKQPLRALNASRRE